MVLVLFLIFSFPLFCQSGNDIKIGYIENGVVIITYDQSKLLRAFEIQYGDSLQASSLECISASPDDYYLTARLQNSSENWSVAEPLKKEGQELFVGAEEAGRIAHKCEGDPCSSCSFVVLDKQIVGCQCNHANGVCNHSIMTSTYYSILKDL